MESDPKICCLCGEHPVDGKRNHCRKCRYKRDYDRHREARCVKNREWQANNRKRAAEIAAEYRNRHPGAAKEADRKWREANPEKIRMKHQMRRAILAGAGAEDVDPNEIYERDGDLCGICGTLVIPAERSLDHIVPIARGGAHTYANLQLAHRRCNYSKGAKLMEELGV